MNRYHPWCGNYFCAGDCDDELEVVTTPALRGPATVQAVFPEMNSSGARSFHREQPGEQWGSPGSDAASREGESSNG